MGFSLLGTVNSSNLAWSDGDECRNGKEPSPGETDVTEEDKSLTVKSL